MNRFVTFKNVQLEIGTMFGNEDIPKVIESHERNNMYKIVLQDKYFNVENECTIVCDITMSHGTIEKLLNIKKRDLYYLYSNKQTVTPEQILQQLENILIDIVQHNLIIY